MLFSGNANPDLARDIAEELGTKLGQISVSICQIYFVLPTNSNMIKGY